MTQIDQTDTPDIGILSYVPLLELRDRADAFSETTGIGRNDLVLSRFVNIALPMYPEQWPAGHRRWAGLTPEGLAHPAAWLPDVLASRLRDPVDDWVEDADLWALRVTLELERRGVLDPSTGAYTDMLAPGFRS